MEHIKRTGRILGSGAKGVVHLGFDEEGGRFVAVKELHLAMGASCGGGHGDDETGGNEQQAAAVAATLQAIRTEVQLLQRAQHENVVKYYGSQVTADGKLTLVMEYVSGGSLASVIKRHAGLRDAVVRAYARDILCGLQYLHDVCRTCHRDVKPENILVTPEGRCKLADFGASRSLEQSTLLKTCIGTPYYMAPEVVQGDGYDEKADVWSFGATLFEMVVGKPPFHDISNPMAVLFRIASAGALPPLPQQVEAVLNPDIKDLMLKCCAMPKQARPSARELLHHPFFSGRIAPLSSDRGGGGGPTCTMPPHCAAPSSPLQAAPAGQHAPTTAAASGSVATAPPTQSMTAATTTGGGVQSPTSNAAASTAAATPAADDDDGAFPFFTIKADHDIEAWRLCHNCRSAIALFSCDACAAVVSGGGATSSRYCASCWGTAHAHQRVVGHVKRPLLMQAAPPAPGQEMRRVTSTGSLASLPSQSVVAAASGSQVPPLAGASASTTGPLPAAGAVPSASVRSGGGGGGGYGSGLLLPDGNFVDVLCAGEQSEWTCGRCCTLNDGPAYACFMCGHLR